LGVINERQGRPARPAEIDPHKKNAPPEGGAKSSIDVISYSNEKFTSA
jgi:hypothetical protein